MNSVLRDCRKCPPFLLFVRAIQSINANFAEKREKYANGNAADIVDDVLAKIVSNTDDGRKLRARNVFGPVFEVDSRVAGNATMIVDLERSQCSCMMFQDLGYPCVHACSAALLACVDVPSLCIDERRIGALRMVYEFGVIPVDIETIHPVPLEPPFVQRLPGRPKVKRIHRRNEDQPKGSTSARCVVKQATPRGPALRTTQK